MGKDERESNGKYKNHPDKGTMQPSFNRCTIAKIGYLGELYDEDNFQKWIELYRDGTFSSDINENVTHVLSTDKDYLNRGPKMRAAIELAKQGKLVIVYQHWFELSCYYRKVLNTDEWDIRKHNLTAKEKKQAAAAIRREEKARAEKDKEAKEKGQKAWEKGFVNTYLNEVHKEGRFAYKIELERAYYDGRKGKYTLFLFRSKAQQPILYQCALTAVSFSAKGYELKREYERVTESEGPFEVALAEFERVFWEKTCIRWDERMVVKKGPESPAGQPAWFLWINRPKHLHDHGRIRDPKNYPAWMRQTDEPKREVSPEPKKEDSPEPKREDSPESSAKQVLQTLDTPQTRSTGLKDAESILTPPLSSPKAKAKAIRISIKRVADPLHDSKHPSPAAETIDCKDDGIDMVMPNRCKESDANTTPKDEEMFDVDGLFNMKDYEETPGAAESGDVEMTDAFEFDDAEFD